VVLHLYKKYGNLPFTAEDCRNIFSDLGERESGMFVYLRSNGVIQLKNGNKRSNIANKNKPNEWIFTPSFISYLQSGGEKHLEA
jgi:hypothetical protein